MDRKRAKTWWCLGKRWQKDRQTDRQTNTHTERERETERARERERERDCIRNNLQNGESLARSGDSCITWGGIAPFCAHKTPVGAHSGSWVQSGSLYVRNTQGSEGPGRGRHALKSSDSLRELLRPNGNGK